jgi:hypothetical protein
MQPEIKNINGIDHVIVAIPVITPKLSSSGKTMVVAQTGAPVHTTIIIQGKPVSYSASAWVAK